MRLLAVLGLAVLIGTTGLASAGTTKRVYVDVAQLRSWCNPMNHPIGSFCQGYILAAADSTPHKCLPKDVVPAQLLQLVRVALKEASASDEQPALQFVQATMDLAYPCP